ncbi:ATP-binding protein [Jeotgalibacillus sp. S-D1]|uniref:ATP-binding protein n=1 Tax=Jeotgalibacillus sp. S-D1 TaxID=2552189 RepID=UPI001059B2D3|nr:ATP-binding protein [Jeotgalibacillus sp. S-D1]TDL32970.1 ATP-binding protein [Jeotgalibacillus sp. S-D1]
MKPSDTGRNALEWSFGEAALVVTTDNSGAIGEKEADEVQVPYPVASYFSFRSAVLDSLSAGAVPAAVLIHNFCGHEAWKLLEEGVQQGIHELGLKGISVTGSTESNMTMNQSAIAVTIIGHQKRLFSLSSEDEIVWSLIGEPLVGMEVLNRKQCIAPLNQLMDLFYDSETAVFWPVGSGGIEYEWIRLCEQFKLPKISVPFEQDLYKSAGPSTCVIVGKKVKN